MSDRRKNAETKAPLRKAAAAKSANQLARDPAAGHNTALRKLVLGRVIADWTGARNYIDPRQGTPQDLAWEFLRRNPHYQSQWELISNSIRSDVDWNGKIWLAWCGRRFGIESMIAPEADGPPQFLPDDIEPVTDHWVWFGRAPLNPTDLPSPHVGCHMVALPFDLHQPLGKQLEKASDFLEWRRREHINAWRHEYAKPLKKALSELYKQRGSIIQREIIAAKITALKRTISLLLNSVTVDTKGPRGRYRLEKKIEKYRTYWRVLDAAAAGVDETKIAEVLAYSRRSVIDDIEAAIKLRDTGYLALAHSSPRM